MREKLSGDLRLLRVIGHSGEKIWFGVSSDDGHCIMILLFYISRASSKSGWKDGSSADIG